MWSTGLPLSMQAAVKHRHAQSCAVNAADYVDANAINLPTV
jgi:hypothetical protein